MINLFFSNKGLVLSGAAGVGKSLMGYILASFAYINKYPLIYIVKQFFNFNFNFLFSIFYFLHFIKQPYCEDWNDDLNYKKINKDILAGYFLNQFSVYNVEIFKDIDNPENQTLKEFNDKILTCRNENWNGAFKIQSDLINFLKNYKSSSVVYFLIYFLKILFIN